MDMVNITLGTAAITGLLGYAVVFFGLILLMIVIMLMGKAFIAKANKAAAEVTAAAPASAASAASAPAVEASRHEAPGTAGELKLYDTDPRDAAMVMAIVADSLGKPLNQLRFISIKEVKE